MSMGLYSSSSSPAAPASGGFGRMLGQASLIPAAATAAEAAPAVAAEEGGATSQNVLVKSADGCPLRGLQRVVGLSQGQQEDWQLQHGHLAVHFAPLKELRAFLSTGSGNRNSNRNSGGNGFEDLRPQQQQEQLTLQQQQQA
ncbi:hypothetical protein EBH_0033020 [Eimeria brunetti]|uniref:Uncharacterized protein n=1 Tax=Eimeria brunetti TaxID=51314 RepID=U6LP39_9EIME|nr:hypothetical protein EBH_0033020 [Eimeria brunetti]